MSFEKTTRICAHNIAWWYRDYNPPELPDSELEHIKSHLCENYVEGELCHLDIEGKTHRGWWKIDK